MTLLDRLRARLTGDVRNFLRWWSVRLQLVCAGLTGWMTFDPQGVLWAWNLMPHPVRAMLPDGFVGGLGAVLFVLNMAAVIARPIRQRRLER